MLTSDDGRPRASLFVVLIGLIALHIIGVATTLSHRSVNPVVLGRYAPDYFLLILVLLALLAGWLAAALALARGARRDRLSAIEEAIARLALDNRIYWPWALGAWAAGLALVQIASARSAIPFEVQTAVLPGVAAATALPTAVRLSRRDGARSHPIVRWLRRDWLTLTGYLTLAILSTYPLLAHMSGDLLPQGTDNHIKLWDIWWLGRVMHTGQPLQYTHDLFFPTGVSLAFHSISYTTSALARLLMTFTSIFTAYKITILIALFASAYAAYLLIRPVVQRPTAAWVGGAIYGFAPYHVMQAYGHPDLAHLAVIPVTVLLLREALSRRSLWLALAAGAVFGLAPWTSLYVLGLTGLTVGVVGLFTLAQDGRWREGGTWLAVAMMVAAALAVSAPRLLPILWDSGSIGEAAAAKYNPNLQIDVVTYLLPSPGNPLFAGWVRPLASRMFYAEGSPPYLGLIPLALTIAAIAARDRRRETWPWVVSGAMFLILSMGPALRAGGALYENIRLPAALLQRIPLFQIVRPHYYFLGLLLPLGVLSAIGLDRLLTMLGDRHGRPSVEFLSGVLVIALAAEYWAGPMPMRAPEVSPFYEELAADSDNYALIDLPMDYDSSKRYLYYQLFHQHPIAGGMIGRIPDSAYVTIEHNALLSRWNAEAPLVCSDLPPERARTAAERLADDGFRYVIVHRDRLRPWMATYFEPADRVYHDELVDVYTVEDMIQHPFCADQDAGLADRAP